MPSCKAFSFLWLVVGYLKKRVAPFADLLRRTLSTSRRMKSKSYLHYHLVVIVTLYTRFITIKIALRKAQIMNG